MYCIYKKEQETGNEQRSRVLSPGRLIELGLTMTWEEREGEQDVRMRRSAVQAQQKQP